LSLGPITSSIPTPPPPPTLTTDEPSPLPGPSTSSSPPDSPRLHHQADHLMAEQLQVPDTTPLNDNDDAEFGFEQELNGMSKGN
jgi:hypothetical protein